jgi:hypothetical protein
MHAQKASPQNGVLIEQYLESLRQGSQRLATGLSGDL